MTVLRRTVVVCNHDQCANEVQTDEQPGNAAVAVWLEQSGWVQFRAKPATGDPSVLNFCPTHLSELRLFFGPLSSADGLVLTQQGPTPD